MTRDPEVTSRIMSAIRSRDTKPELLIRRVLWRRGLRYRLNLKLYGRPDLVFTTPRLAVFVDGDYWHGNAWRVRGLASFDAQFELMNNGSFWRAKIERNMARDREVNESLSQDHWRVYRVFESRLLRDTDLVADEIESLVRGGHDS